MLRRGYLHIYRDIEVRMEALRYKLEACIFPSQALSGKRESSHRSLIK